MAGYQPVEEFRSLKLELRQAILRKAAKGAKPRPEFWIAAHDPELRSEVLDRVLAHVARNHFDYVSVLASFPENERVLTALVRAISAAPLKYLAPIAMAAGRVRAKGALLPLRRRFRELIHRGFRGYLVAAVGSVILCLNPRATTAAALLASMVRSADPAEREAAARGLSCPIDYRAQTGAMKRVRDALSELLESDPEATWIAAGALRTIAPVKFAKRCKEALSGAPALDRELAAAELLRTKHPSARATVVRWLRREQDLTACLSVAQMLGRSLPGDVARRLARGALASASPFTRLQAIEMLELCGNAELAGLAREASKDEPDAFLQRRLANVQEQSRKQRSRRSREESC